MHQHPPKMPLLRSTSAANAVHVDSSRAFTVYVGSGTQPSLMRARSRRNERRFDRLMLGWVCEPVSGFEPLTCRLQDGCSAN